MGFGVSPPTFFAALFNGAFGDFGRVIATLVKFSPFVLTGLAFAVPLKGGLFNIGAQGQMYAGALGAVWLALAFPSLPAYALLPLVLAAATAMGAVYGGIAGILKSRFRVHEVIATIMLNLIAAHGLAFLVNGGPLSAPGGVGRSPMIPEAATLPVIARSGALKLSAGLGVAVLAVFAGWWFVSRSVAGFRLRAVGGNPIAAKRHGINTARTTVAAFVAGGAFAGLAGAVEVCGSHHFVSADFSPGYGFDGIAVALLAGSNLLGILPAALLFAAMRAAGTMLQLDTGLSPEIILVLEALVVIAAAVPMARRIRGYVATPAVEAAPAGNT